MIENKTVVCDAVGFYKVPINPEVNTIFEVNVRQNDINGIIEQTHYIIVEDVCPNDTPVKWLATEGFYKFGSFDRYDSFNRVASTNLTIPKFFTAFADTDTRDDVISKDLQKSITLQKRQVPTAVLEYYLDLASSPKVYMYIDGEWIQVQVSWTPTYSAKKNFHNIAVLFDLPKSYIQSL